VSDSLEFGRAAGSHSRSLEGPPPWAAAGHWSLSAGCWPDRQTGRAPELSASCELPLQGQTITIISVNHMFNTNTEYSLIIKIISFMSILYSFKDTLSQTMPNVALNCYPW